MVQNQCNCPSYLYTIQVTTKTATATTTTTATANSQIRVEASFASAMNTSYRRLRVESVGVLHYVSNPRRVGHTNMKCSVPGTRVVGFVSDCDGQARSTSDRRQAFLFQAIECYRIPVACVHHLITFIEHTQEGSQRLPCKEIFTFTNNNWRQQPYKLQRELLQFDR